MIDQILDMCGLAQISLGLAGTDLSRVECLFVCHHSSAFTLTCWHYWYGVSLQSVIGRRFKRLPLGNSFFCIPLFRFQFSGADCIAVLEQEGYEFTALGGFNEGQCQIDTPVRITSLTHLSSYNPELSLCTWSGKMGWGWFQAPDTLEATTVVVQAHFLWVSTAMVTQLTWFRWMLIWVRTIKNYQLPLQVFY